MVFDTCWMPAAGLILAATGPARRAELVYVSKSLQGYDRQDAIRRVPDEMRVAVSNHVYGLEKLGVKQNQSFAIADNARYAQELRGDLKGLLGASKADGILKGLTVEALRGNLHGKIEMRMNGPDADSVSHLKELLHFGAFRSGAKLDSADRMMVRTALVLAFAHGASRDEMTDLREALVHGDTSLREQGLKALNIGTANASNVLAHLSGGDQSPSINRMLNWCDLHQGKSTGTRLPVGGEIQKKVTAYFEANPGQVSSSREGAVAVGIYASQAYGAINTALRSDTKPTGKVAEIVKHATQFLETMPDFKGIVCRGGGSGWQETALAKYKPGAVVTEAPFTSTSPNKGFEGSIQFIIESRHGKEITDLSILAKNDGREVLFKPGTKFEVLAVEQGDADYIYMPIAPKYEIPGQAKLETPKDAKPKVEVMEKTTNKDSEKTMFIIMRELD